jgi:hypothetical protein
MPASLDHHHCKKHDCTAACDAADLSVQLYYQPAWPAGAAHHAWKTQGTARQHRPPPRAGLYLPTGFYFYDRRWKLIWQRFEQKGEALSHDDLRALFPDEPVLRAGKP